MMRVFVAMIAFALAACNGSRQEPDTRPPPSGSASERGDSAGPGDAVAYFAGGCFWGVEHYMQQLEGVTSVESGYMGGHIESPTYEQVSSGESGHLETVRVRFRSDRVSYEEVAKLFFEIHDPTQADGQGPDIGSQYLSAVFYASPEQERIAEELIGELKTRGYDVVTQVRSAGEFYPAEDYHQDYYDKKGGTPYCHLRVPRFESEP